MSLSAGPVDLDAVLLSIGPPRAFTKRDGSTGEMAEAVIGDNEGTARLVAWVPELLAECSPGMTVHIANARTDNRPEEGARHQFAEKGPEGGGWDDGLTSHPQLNGVLGEKVQVQIFDNQHTIL